MKIIKLIFHNQIPRKKDESFTLEDSSMTLNLIAERLSFYYTKAVVPATVGEIKYRSISFIISGYKEALTIEAVDNADVLMQTINYFLENNDTTELILSFKPTGDDVLVVNDEARKETKIPVSHGWIINILKGDEDGNEADI